MSKKIPIDIDLNAREAQRAASELAKKIGEVDESLGEAESAGKQMARAISAQADEMISEIDATRRAVDALELALGDAVDGIDTTAVVADLKKVGLTADDIETDAKDLAEALKRAGEVRVHAADAGFTDLDQALGRTTENSRVASTAIGGIGNSISELPGIGSLGPVAESMGMLAENALEGEANLKSVVVAGGGLAALGITMGVISKAMSSMAETKAFNSKQVESFRDAIKEVGAGIGAVNEYFQQAEKITGWAGGMGPFFEKTKDITDQLIDAGVSYEEWIAGVEAGGPALDLVTGKLEAQRAKMVDARNEAQRNGEATVGYERAISDLGNAIEIASEVHDNYGKAVEDNTRRTEWMSEASKAATQTEEEATAARERAIETADKQRESIQGVIDATLALGDSSLAYRNQQADTSSTIAEASLVLADGQRSAEEHAQALRDMEGAAYAQAAAAVRQAEDQAKANGETLTAQEKAAIYRSELQTLSGYLTGPAKEAIDGHIARLDAIPETAATTITADTRAANAQLDSLIGKLNAIGSTATSVSVVAANRFRQSHTGSRFEAGETKYVVPGQVFTPDTPGRLSSVEESRRMTSGQRRAEQSVNVTINGVQDPQGVRREMEALFWRGMAR